MGHFFFFYRYKTNSQSDMPLLYLHVYKMPNMFRHAFSLPIIHCSPCSNICAGPVITRHLHEETTAASPTPYVCVCECVCVFICFLLNSSLLYSHGWNLEVGLPVEAVRHLEGRGAVHLPHTFQRDHVQLELGYQIEACKGQCLGWSWCYWGHNISKTNPKNVIL